MHRDFLFLEVMVMIKYVIIFIVMILLAMAGVWILSPKSNPLLGQWASTDYIYGQPERLTFTEFGLFKGGSHVPAEFDIGRQKVIVTTNSATTEYLIVSENMIKQRVPRQTWRFFLRVDSELVNTEVFNDRGISRYK